MMANIEVRDADGKVVHTYEMYAAGYGTLVCDEDLFEEAKRNVIDDGLVSQDEADKLTFTITD